MKLWTVRNVKDATVLVIAPSEVSALELAALSFIEDMGGRKFEAENYQNLRARMLCDDTGLSWRGVVTDA